MFRKQFLYENLSSKQHFYVEMVAGGSVLGKDIELGKMHSKEVF
jgi:hypothetical protein